MRDSGVRWLGEIPEHWDVVRNGRLFTQRNETGYPDLPILEVSLQTGVRVRDFDASGRKQRMSDRKKYKRARTGDITYNMMRMWQGAVGVAPVDGLVSPAYVVARPLEATNSTYFERLFRLPAYMGEVNQRSRGIVPDRNRLYWEDFKQIASPLPPPAEQAAIVRFLDHMDGQVRRYVRAKQELIELLEKLKTAIIHRAVTRGLDSDVRLKPSAVEWLGEVPGHWKIAALRYRYSQSLGKMLDTKQMSGTHLVPYLRNTDVQWDKINIDNLPTMDITESEYDRYAVKEGDLLVCEGGEVGRCAIWAGELKRCGFQKALHRLRPRCDATDLPRFMYYALYSAARTGVLSDGHVSTIEHLTGDKLRAHHFPFPPFQEQREIVSFLDSFLAGTNRAITSARRQVDLLREFRTRLINDLVTGKLDVREAAGRLPDESEDAAALMDLEDLTGDEEGAPQDLDLDTEFQEARA